MFSKGVSPLVLPYVNIVSVNMSEKNDAWTSPASVRHREGNTSIYGRKTIISQEIQGHVSFTVITDKQKGIHLHITSECNGFLRSIEFKSFARRCFPISKDLLTKQINYVERKASNRLSNVMPCIHFCILGTSITVSKRRQILCSVKDRKLECILVEKTSVCFLAACFQLLLCCRSADF